MLNHIGTNEPLTIDTPRSRTEIFTRTILLENYAFRRSFSTPPPPFARDVIARREGGKWVANGGMECTCVRVRVRAEGEHNLYDDWRVDFEDSSLSGVNGWLLWGIRTWKTCTVSRLVATINFYGGFIWNLTIFDISVGTVGGGFCVLEIEWFVGVNRLDNLWTFSEYIWFSF